MTQFFVSVCAIGKETSTNCFCKAPNGNSGETCSTNQGCDQTGVCLDGKVLTF